MDIAMRAGGRRLYSVVARLIGYGVLFPCHFKDAHHYSDKITAKLIESGLVYNPYDGLSSRATYCLMNADVDSKDQVAEAISTGKLNPLPGTTGVRNYGWKTHREVCAWAGLPVPQPKARGIILKWRSSRPDINDRHYGILPTESYWWIRGGNFNRPVICQVNIGVDSAKDESAPNGRSFWPALYFSVLSNGYPHGISDRDLMQMPEAETWMWCGPIPPPPS